MKENPVNGGGIEMANGTKNAWIINAASGLSLCVMVP
jgi:hypothetical protein